MPETPLTNPASELQPAPASVQVQPVQELAEFLDFLAAGFPVYHDPVADELDGNAYRFIRRTDVTAYPVEKLGALLAGNYSLRAVGEGPRVAFIQEIIDRMPRLKSAIHSLTWGVVEGVIFGALTATPRRGRLIPQITVLRKSKAGGPVEWDGQFIVRPRRFPTVTADAGDAEPMKLERGHFVVFQPGGHHTPEGDTDLAWRLYLLAQLGQENRKNIAEYSHRHGLPLQLIRKSLENVRPDRVAEKLESASAILKNLAQRGAAMSLNDVMQLLEPTGSTWGFLLQLDQMLRTSAHQLVLLNSLTSETASAGPTGSSRIHKNEQTAAVEFVGGAMAEAFTADLLPFIEKYNAALLPPGECWLEFQPIATERETAMADVFAALDRGVRVTTDWLYEKLGAPRPEGLPDVIGGESPGDEPAEEATVPLTARPGTLKLAAANGESRDGAPEAIVQAMEHLELALAEGRDAAPAEAVLENELAQRGGAMFAAGSATMRKDAREITRKLESAEENARLWRVQARLAARAANVYLAANVNRKLAEFIAAQGALGDRREFFAWWKARQASVAKAYADLVWRNAINSAYSLGRLAAYRDGAEILGLNRQLLTAADERVRESHWPYHEIVLPPGEAWDKFLPPFDHNCRCTWIVTELEPSPPETLARLEVPPFGRGK